MNRQITNSIKHLLLTAFAVIALGVSADNVSADEYSRIKSRAVKIRNKTKQLLKETEHYTFTPNYRVLVSDAAALRQLAEHTRLIAKEKGDLDHLAADLAEMDQTFHHLANLFDSTELLAAENHGKVKGNTAHVGRLLDSIEECIYEIRSDIETLRHSVVIATPVVVEHPIVVQRPVVADSCPYGGYGGGRQVQPIITKVETYKVPVHKVYPHSKKHSGYGGWVWQWLRWRRIQFLYRWRKITTAL